MWNQSAARVRGACLIVPPESDPALERRQRRGVYYHSEQLRIATASVLPPINGRSGGATPTKREREATCVPLRYSSSLGMKLWVNDHTPSPGMALCGYSVGITQIIWARTAAGCSSRSTPASIRKVALFLLIHTAFISPETMGWEFHAAIFVDEVPCKIPCKIPC